MIMRAMFRPQLRLGTAFFCDVPWQLSSPGMRQSMSLSETINNSNENTYPPMLPAPSNWHPNRAEPKPRTQLCRTNAAGRRWTDSRTSFAAGSAIPKQHPPTCSTATPCTTGTDVRTNQKTNGIRAGSSQFRRESRGDAPAKAGAPPSCMSFFSR
jgi:hypothetical protein